MKSTNIEITLLQKPKYLRKYPTQRFDLWLEDSQNIWGYNGTIKWFFVDLSVTVFYCSMWKVTQEYTTTHFPEKCLMKCVLKSHFYFSIKCFFQKCSETNSTEVFLLIYTHIKTRYWWFQNANNITPISDIIKFHLQVHVLSDPQSPGNIQDFSIKSNLNTGIYWVVVWFKYRYHWW